MNRTAANRGGILVVSEGISFCHVVRPLILSQWLQSLGKPMLVACPDKHRSFFEGYGFITTSIRTADPEKIYGRLAKGGTLYSTSEIGKYYHDDERLLARVKPELVVADFRFTIQQLCQERHRIPVVGITSASCHPNYAIEGTSPNCFLPPLLPVSWADRLQQGPFGSALRRLTVKQLSKPYQRASRQAGLQELPDFFHYASQGDVCALADHPEVMPIGSLRPQDVYTGALLWKREEPLPDSLSGLTRNTRSKPTVYFTVGTQESMSIAFLDRMLGELIDSGFSVVLSKGNRSFRVTVEHQDLFAFDFINESKLLPLVDAWVYHGSAMSTYQGLACGVPMISIPVQADQHFHSEAIVKLGCGQLVRPREFSNKSVVELVGRLVKSKSVKARCKEVSAMLQSYSGKDEFLSRVSELLPEN